jgi:hypothetical protein
MSIRLKESINKDCRQTKLSDYELFKIRKDLSNILEA